MAISRRHPAAVFAVLTVAVLIRVIAHQRVTSHTVIGAICGYLLIGYVFTFGYLVVVFIDPSSIHINGQPLGVERVTNIGEHMAELFYFSFITLTTVGYGDIVPACPVTRMLVLIEILTGQLYLAAFVARLKTLVAGGDYVPTVDRLVLALTGQDQKSVV